ncbi:SEC-C domain-containing protein [Pseudomonas fluorescens]|uniref:SEC-C domain-containing protein n=1 Tax=Pseudomonas fluorescens TaxID=294 RepID=UPI002ACA1408|nr:SEC-C domain-containing protein [Pseudomonas fluorescens]MDZ5433580.1 SEC-C domain-containing protein [Pseudomonas fluorescens]
MLKPVSKQSPTNDSERILNTIATKTFFSLWSYPGIYRDVSNGQEVADLTVFFNNTLILFSDKGEVKFQSHKPVKLAWARWYRAAIKESAKQLHGAEKFIRDHPNRIFTDQSCKELFPYDLSSKDLKIHLVCVTRGITDAAKQHWDSYGTGSAGTLLSSYRLNEQQTLERPFTINDINPDKTFVHILDETGLHLLLTELATPTDFLNYLDCKEKAVRRGNLIGTGGEEDLLAYYLEGLDERGYGSIRHPATDTSRPYTIHEWMWREFKKSTAYIHHYTIKKSGELWAKILSNFSDSVINATVGEGQDLPLLSHAEILQRLAAENMESRAKLATGLIDKFHTVPELARSSRLMTSTCYDDRLYIFVFFPWDEAYESYEEYRQERALCMQMYAVVARYKFPDPKEIVIFGTTTKGRTPGSETIMIADSTFSLTPEARRHAQEIMRYEKILDDVVLTKNGIPSTASQGRNDKCLCGSGKKFKKCHGK